MNLGDNSIKNRNFMSHKIIKLSNLTECLLDRQLPLIFEILFWNIYQNSKGKENTSYLGITFSQKVEAVLLDKIETSL